MDPDPRSYSATLPPSDQHTRVPSEYTNHPLIDTWFFFTLPKELLEDIVDAVGEHRFDEELLQLERSLSRDIGDHSAYVGYRVGAPIRYNLLEPPMKAAALASEINPEME